MTAYFFTKSVPALDLRHARPGGCLRVREGLALVSAARDSRRSGCGGAAADGAPALLQDDNRDPVNAHDDRRNDHEPMMRRSTNLFMGCEANQTAAAPTGRGSPRASSSR